MSSRFFAGEDAVIDDLAGQAFPGITCINKIDAHVPYRGLRVIA